MVFKCCYTWENQTYKEWNGAIRLIRNYGNHFEFDIQSLSSIRVLFGKTVFGFFACMPDFQAGCHLGTPDDINYNIEKLTSAMNNIVDGVTIAYALETVSNMISF